jgi:hypothetical protein
LKRKPVEMRGKKLQLKSEVFRRGHKLNEEGQPHMKL